MSGVDDHEPKGQPLRLDETAASADPDKPAFLARPIGAPVYHGFPILDDVEVDGFRLGMITDWEADPDTRGDAFVVAPDNGRCGLDFEVKTGAAGRIEEVRPPDVSRWGVWYVTFPHPMDSRENARRNLDAILPLLRPHWEEWKATRSRKTTQSIFNGLRALLRRRG